MTLRAFSVCRVRARSGADSFRQVDLWRPLAASTGDILPDKVELMSEETGAATQDSELLSEALIGLEKARNELAGRMESFEERFRQECASTLAQIISAAAPSICEAAAKDAIAAIFTDEREEMRAEVISFVASPDIYGVVQAECDRRSIETLIKIDEELEPGAIRVRWPGGGFECDVGRSLFSIVEFISSKPHSTLEKPL